MQEKRNVHSFKSSWYFLVHFCFYKNSVIFIVVFVFNSWLFLGALIWQSCYLQVHFYLFHYCYPSFSLSCAFHLLFFPLPVSSFSFLPSFLVCFIALAWISRKLHYLSCHINSPKFPLLELLTLHHFSWLKYSLG